MCRDLDHAGNRTNVRCACDTSEARQARRERARVAAVHAPELEKSSAHIQYTLVTEGAAVVNDAVELVLATDVVLTRDETLSIARDELSSYHDILVELGERTEAKKASTELTAVEAEAERRLIVLGDAVQRLSATDEEMPSDEEFATVAERLNERREEFKAQLIITKAEVMRTSAACRTFVLRPNPESFLERAALYEANANAVKVHNKLIDEKTAQAETENDPEFAALAARRAAAYRRALTDLGVKFADPDAFTYRIDKSRPKLEKNLRSAISHYPASWVAEAQERDEASSTVRIYQQGKRAHYAPISNQIRVSTADESTLTHELAHYLEGANRGIGESERYFINRRAGLLAHSRGSSTPQPRLSFVSGRELGYTDEFVHGYVGRIYTFDAAKPRNNGAYEVLSVGMENIFHGHMGANTGTSVYKADREHVSFVLGLLASSAKE